MSKVMEEVKTRFAAAMAMRVPKEDEDMPKEDEDVGVKTVPNLHAFGVVGLHSK